MPRNAMPKRCYVARVIGRKQKFFALKVAVDTQHNLACFPLTDEEFKATAKAWRKKRR
jgi:hypothetical protein